MQLLTKRRHLTYLKLHSKTTTPGAAAAVVDAGVGLLQYGGPST